MKIDQNDLLIKNCENKFQDSVEISAKDEQKMTMPQPLIES